MLEILFRRLVPDAEPPRKAHDGDAGWDVTAASYRNENGIHVYGTGLAFAVPKGCWLDARARSSIYKRGLWLSNGVGTIDSAYRGEVGAMFYSMMFPCDPYKVGERIIQLIPMPIKCDEVVFAEVDELPESWDGRGEGGFGSTGR